MQKIGETKDQFTQENHVYGMRNEIGKRFMLRAVYVKFYIMNYIKKSLHHNKQEAFNSRFQRSKYYQNQIWKSTNIDDYKSNGATQRNLEG